MILLLILTKIFKYICTPNDGRGRQVPRFHIKNFISNLHYGMQIFKTKIIKDNKYLIGPDYDYRADTLFITDMYKKYGNMRIIMENLIQYVREKHIVDNIIHLLL